MPEVQLLAVLCCVILTVWLPLSEQESCCCYDRGGKKSWQASYRRQPKS